MGKPGGPQTPKSAGSPKSPNKPSVTIKIKPLDNGESVYCDEFVKAVGADDEKPLPHLTCSKASTLHANFFQVKLGKIDKVYQYSINRISKVPRESDGSKESEKARIETNPRGTKNTTLSRSQTMQIKNVSTSSSSVSTPGVSSPGGPPVGNSNAGGAQGPVVTLPACVRRRLMFLLLDEMQSQGIAPIASDYKEKLITIDQINHTNVPGTWRIAFYDEDETGASANAPRYDIEEGFSPSTEFANAEAFFSAMNQVPDLLNLLYSHRPNQYTRRTPQLEECDVTFSGANKFFHLDWPANSKPPYPLSIDRRQELTGAVVAIPGFFRSVRSSLGANLLLNINTCTSAFYHHDILTGLIGGYGANEPLYKIENFIRGLRVRTTYIRKSPHCQKRAKESGSATATPTERIHTIRGLPFLNPRPVPGNVFFTEYDNTKDDDGKKENKSDDGKKTKLQQGNSKSSSHNGKGDSEVDGGKEISVGDYWRKTHNDTLGREDLIVDCGRGGYVPAKYLKVLKGQPYKHKTEMVRDATRPPAVNYRMIITDGMKMFGFNPRDNIHSPMNVFGLDVEQQMTKVRALRIPAPNLNYRNNPAVVDKDLQSGSWNLRNRQCRAAAPGQVWSLVELVRYDRPRPYNERMKAYNNSNHQTWGASTDALEKFARMFQNNMAAFGLTGFSRNTPAQMQSVKIGMQSHKNSTNQQQLNNDYQSILRVLTELRDGTSKVYLRNPVRLVVVLLPEEDQDLYSFVKRIGDQALGIQTICHVSRSRRDRGPGTGCAALSNYWGPAVDPGTIASLHMKLNLKLSALSSNQIFAHPEVAGNGVLTQLSMIVGLDVTHPGPNALDNAPSVAAMVASVDDAFAQWPAILRANPRPIHNSGVSMERIVVLKEMIIDRLNRFASVRGQLPDRIIVYRDGLSEQQFDMCRTREIPQLKHGVEEVYTAANVPNPNIILICAVKRNHARFFADPPDHVNPDLIAADGNPRPGVVVFNQVTYGGARDFYLVSQGTLIGTTRPTHYVVLHNEVPKVKISDIAGMTHSLCFLFGRATRSVGVVPAAYYADLACDRARCYVRSTYVANNQGVYSPAKFNLNLHPVMQNRMFYI